MNIEQLELTEKRVKIFKALADETRLAILKALYHSSNELSCAEVGYTCDTSKSNASYHFKTLREAGLIKVRKEGQTRYMRINKETFDQILPGFLDTL
ncbi:metalloregulator ArsR/SmtB family transcription factor [Brevibacillus formosus]|uniref:Transcriptional regulator n=1 Tax=Brevibacillus formosus TaxID=54913 RepID=A0A837KFQ2_9BACL|nr:MULTISPECIES: metalloregulator ArsR/SmtB family transcription factor [Brevibacillus]KLH96607.1 transcriptional regulator [Brevibacillus formosus]MBG9941375.1 transcriptional regulator [Brevibacillus formosus]MED1948870.1 metalloregulator ArsR/SmtB family transcription factor [Brevibacillus formosus]MED1960250.1 metalloregulator ArsR/SmtB family transcription factor [Brevibacillus formosus]MED2001393.1 metalloregulator ArsR/SmtB family transcription factor [Brevibacillus formosus]